MFIDARGLSHPEHLKEFKRHLAGLCTVKENVEVLIDNRNNELKMFELYVRTFKCSYKIETADNYARIKIKAPFNICGF
ncbi:MAG: hypothetical protein HY099_00840 [Nitrospirae bacterium]|nr:hypothetical protein [Nitrospirota bacterium]